MSKKKNTVGLIAVGLLAVAVVLVRFPLPPGSAAPASAEARGPVVGTAPVTGDTDVQPAPPGPDRLHLDAGTLAAPAVITITLAADILLLNPQYYFVDLPVVVKDAQ